MYNFLTKNGQLLAFGLGALITVIYFIFVFTSGDGLDAFSSLSEKDPARFQDGRFSFGIGASGVLTIACFVFALGFGLYQMFSDLKGSLKGIIMIVAVLAIFGIFYATSAAEGMESPLYETITEFEIDDTTSKLISAGIKTTLTTLALGALALVVSEVLNFFK